MSAVIINDKNGGVAIDWNGELYVITCEHCITGWFAKVTYKDGHTERVPCVFKEILNDVVILRGNKDHVTGSMLATKYLNASVTMVHHHPRPFSQTSGKTYRNYSHSCGCDVGSIGSPLYNKKGQVVGIHESWDDKTYKKYLINCETLREVFREMDWY